MARAGGGRAMLVARRRRSLPLGPCPRLTRRRSRIAPQMRSSAAEFRFRCRNQSASVGFGSSIASERAHEGRFLSGPEHNQRYRPLIATLTNQTPRFPHKNTFNPDDLTAVTTAWEKYIEIHLFACRRFCCSAHRLECRGRGPERCRIGLFHGKRIADRERRAVESGRNDRRPSFIPVRIQGSSHQSPQWTLRSGHGQRSRPVCSRPHYRHNAGCRSSTRFFRACAGYGRAGIG
jgi:hypothetical protein